MALPILIDSEDENNPINYTTDLVRKMYDTLKNIIKVGDDVNGVDNDNSKVPVKYSALHGYAGWSSNPRLVNSNFASEDQNTWFYSRFDLEPFNENFLSDFHYIGGNSHLTEFANPFPDVTGIAIISDIENNVMNMDMHIKPELLPIMTKFYLRHDTGRDWTHILYDNAGVEGSTLYTNYTTYDYKGVTQVNSTSECQIYFSSAEYSVGSDYWGNEILTDYPDSTYLSGSAWDLGTVHFYSDMPSVIINPSSDTNTINNINNTYTTNNTNNYSNTYTYNNQTYNYYYGDSYITIYYPDGSNGLPFDDVRNIFNDTLENLDIDVVLPTYNDIKYADQGSFYITPIKQIDTLPSAPDVGDTVPDISDYLSVVGGAVTSFYNIVDGLGVSLMFTFTFLVCLVINHLKKG